MDYQAHTHLTESIMHVGLYPIVRHTVGQCRELRKKWEEVNILVLSCLCAGRAKGKGITFSHPKIQKKFLARRSRREIPPCLIVI